MVLAVTVLIGRAQHAQRILQGAQRQTVIVSNELKAQLRSQLITAAGPATWHRDGLLFEVISWIVAHMTANQNDLISTPHLKSTQQGLDTIKVHFDPAVRNVTRAVVYEQKCTENARDQFRDEVLPSFRDWRSGKRDNQLIQATIGLLDRYNLTDDEHLQIYDQLVTVRPIAFQATLTVTPTPFETARCVALFTGFDGITPNMDDRLGDTFPLADIRAWFADFARRIWEQVEATNV